MRTPSQLFAIFGAVVCLGVGMAVAQGGKNTPAQNLGAAPPAPVLIKVADIFHVPRDTENLSFPVDIEGVVVLPAIERASFFFHDGQMGIHISQPNGPEFKSGDRVRVIGDTRRGRFAPSVIPRTVIRLGDGPLPDPRPASYNQVASGSMDSQWVEIEGVVASVNTSPDKRQMQLDLAVDGGRLRAVVDRPLPPQPELLLDSEVRVRGVVTSRFNKRGQMVEPLLRVPAGAWVTVVRPGPADPFALPIRSINRLLEFSIDRQPQHRIKVQGVVTRCDPETTFFLRDSGHGLKVETSSPVTLQAGDRIEAVGFPVIVNDEVVIQNALSRKIAVGAPPAPILSDVRALLTGSHASDLVSIQARLVDWVTDGPDTTLIFEAGNHVFKGLLRQTNGAVGTMPENGSLVEATGICVFSELENLWPNQPHPFQMLLATPEDLRVVQQPPWWTAERLWRALLFTLALLAAGAAWVWALQRQVQRKRSVIACQASHAAVLEERSRIARDLHDTLEQGLTGLSLQFKAIETDLNGMPHPVVAHLALARQMLRESRALARNAIRELRIESVPPPPEGFLTALRNAADMWNHSGALAVKMLVAGEPRPLPGDIERNLGGIGTEAMTNAVKHGRASSVQIDVTFSGDLIALRIEDNGSGFDPTTIRSTAHGCFGLVGMRERALEMGARLEVQSQPGHGTKILVEVPLAASVVRQKPNGAQAVASRPTAPQPT